MLLKSFTQAHHPFQAFQLRNLDLRHVAENHLHLVEHHKSVCQLAAQRIKVTTAI